MPPVPEIVSLLVWLCSEVSNFASEAKLLR